MSLLVKNIQDCDKIVFNNNAFVAVPSLLNHFMKESKKTHSDILDIINSAITSFTNQKLNQSPPLKSEIVQKFCETLIKRIQYSIEQAYS